MLSNADSPVNTPQAIHQPILQSSLPTPYPAHKYKVPHVMVITEPYSDKELTTVASEHHSSQTQCPAPRLCSSAHTSNNKKHTSPAMPSILEPAESGPSREIAPQHHVADYQPTAACCCMFTNRCTQQRQSTAHYIIWLTASSTAAAARQAPCLHTKLDNCTVQPSVHTCLWSTCPQPENKLQQ